MTLTWKRGFCRLRAKGGYDVPSGVGDNRLKVVLVGITVGNPDACWVVGGAPFLGFKLRWIKEDRECYK